MQDSGQESSLAERLRWVFIGGAFLIGSLVSGGAILAGESFTGFLLNLGTEIIGAALLYIVLDIFIGRFESQEAAERAAAAEKQELLDQMRSTVKSIAARAIERLKATDMWYDGSLSQLALNRLDFSGVDLNYISMRESECQEVDFTEAWLTRADLKKASMTHCIFKRAQLKGAFFRSSQLISCNFSRAYCQDTDFRYCILRRADFSGATLHGTDFRGADLSGANLYNAQLSRDTRFDESTTMPDGKHYAPGMDLTPYTETPPV